MEIKTGKNYPQGATSYDDGTNFAIYSENATSIDLQFFKKQDDKDPYETVKLTEKDDYI